MDLQNCWKEIRDLKEDIRIIIQRMEELKEELNYLNEKFDMQHYNDNDDSGSD